MTPFRHALWSLLQAHKKLKVGDLLKLSMKPRNGSCFKPVKPMGEKMHDRRLRDEAVLREVRAVLCKSKKDISE